MTAFLFLCIIGKPLFSENGEKDRQDYAYDDACRDGKVKAEPFFVDINIAGQFDKKRYPIGEQKSKPDNDEDNSNYNQHFTHCGHQTAFQYRSFSRSERKATESCMSRGIWLQNGGC